MSLALLQELVFGPTPDLREQRLLATQLAIASLGLATGLGAVVFLVAGSAMATSWSVLLLVGLLAAAMLVRGGWIAWAEWLTIGAVFVVSAGSIATDAFSRGSAGFLGITAGVALAGFLRGWQTGVLALGGALGLAWSCNTSPVRGEPWLWTLGVLTTGLLLVTWLLGMLELERRAQRQAFVSMFDQVRAAERHTDAMVALDYVDDVLRACKDLLIVTDRSGHVGKVSPSVCAALGYRAADLIGTHISHIVTGDLHNLEAHDPVEVRYRRRDGSTFVALQTKGRLDPSVGRGAGFVWVASDLTSRRKAEGLIRASSERAQLANEAKSRFLASMSHEFRTPLATIIGMAEMLLESPRDQQSENDLVAVRDAGRHLARLVDGVLDLARIEAGRLEVEARPFEVASMLREMEAAVLPLVQRNRNMLLLEVDPSLQMVGDREKLKQVMLNLVSTAARFTEEGIIRVSVEAGRDVVFSIRDTGMGMSEEQLTHALERGAEPLPLRTSAVLGGASLGMTICRQLVGTLGGTLSVDSSEGQGTVFRLVLPAEGAAEETPLSVVRRRGTGDHVVICVDEDPERGLALAGALQSDPSLAVVTTTSAADLIPLTGESPPAVVVIRQPSGVPAVRSVQGWRSRSGMSAVPLVVLTDNSVGDDVTSYTDALVLTEPIDMGQLRSVVSKRCGLGADVLVVDDDEDLRELVRFKLEARGAVVREAADGEQALEILESVSVDVVLVDLDMPGLDGFDFVDRFRRRKAWSNTTVLVLTAGDLVDSDLERLAGTAAVLHKATALANLESEVRRAMGAP